MMKFTNIIMVLLIGFQFSIPNQIDQDLAAKIEFDKTTNDFGHIKVGEQNLFCVFTYKNTGNDLLFISRVKKSCGCTLPEYSSEPLRPGETATIKVGYTATDEPGPFNKKMTVFTNALNNAVVLTIKGEVVE